MNELMPVSENANAVALSEDRFEKKDLQSWHKNVDTDRRSILRYAFRVFFGIFVLGGIWAATAPLGGAIVASGRIIAEDRNRVIQHLEGGILAELPVREGDKVTKGQVLAVLDDTQVGAQLHSNKLQRAILRVQLARRRAEVQQLEAVQFPRDLDPSVAAHPRVLEAIVSQQEEFESKRSFLEAADEIIDNQIKGQEGDIDGLNEVLTAMNLQIDLYRKEEANYQDLFDKGLLEAARLYATQRQVADLDARIARTKLDIKAAENNIGTLRNEKRQKRLQFTQDSHAKLVELQQQINRIDGAVARLEDMQDRLVVRSPDNGTIFQVAKRTLGAVIQPGEAIMELFPDDDRLTIEAKLEERHRSKVEVNQEAAISFPGNRVESMIQFPATVTYVSVDAIEPEDPRLPRHYIMRVTLNEEPEGISNYMPGKQAEVFVITEPQTFFDIILSPITRFTKKAFSE